MGGLAFERRRYDDAVKYFSEARKSGDRTPQTSLGLARAYELLGKNKEASENYDRAVDAAGALFPEALEMAGLFFTTKGAGAKGHDILGNYFLQTGRPREAAFHFRETLKIPAGSKYKFKVDQFLRDLEPFSQDMDEKREEEKGTSTSRNRPRPFGDASESPFGPGR